MKFWKIIKMSILSITSMSGVIFAIDSCGINDSYPQNNKDFKEFEKKAESESLENIISDSNPAPNGWASIAANNLTQNLFKVNGHKISVLIGVISLKQAATFSITYTKNKPYNVYDWSCLIQPSRPTDFNFFKMMAKVEPVLNIVEYANNPAVAGWEKVAASDLVKLSITATKDSITINIKDSLKHQSALFKASYIMNTAYQLVDWSCQQQPVALPNFDDFKKAAEAESAINVVDHANSPAQGWNKAIANNVKIETDTIVHNTLVLKIYDVVKAESATFSNTYTMDHKYNIDLWRCVLQPTQLPVFSDFKKAAEAESIENILKNANPKAIGWDNLPKNDLLPSGVSTTKNSVIINIIAISKKSVESFEATYTDFVAYKVTDWKSIAKPKLLPNFDDFTKKAERESAINIVNHSGLTANTGWVGLGVNDVIIKSKTTDKHNNVIETIGAISRNEIATFTATYTRFQRYTINDWTCNIKPKKSIYNFANFTKKAKAESLINIVKNATNKASGWDKVTAGDLSQPTWSVTKNSVSVSFIYKMSPSQGSIATFSATYPYFEAYKVKDWSCSIQPKLLPNWDEFKAAALADANLKNNIGAGRIVRNANPAFPKWAHVPKTVTFTSFGTQVNETAKTIIAIISTTDSVYEGSAYFRISYSLYKTYNIKDWEYITH